MMRLSDVQTLMEAIAEGVAEYGREAGFPLEVYQPLVDGLTQLRLSYSYLGYKPELLGGIPESALALSLLIEALDLIRSMLVLPTVMIDGIGRSDVHIRPRQVKHRYYELEAAPGLETEALSETDTGDVSAFLENYNSLVREVIHRLEEWGEYDSTTVLVSRYFEGGDV